MIIERRLMLSIVGSQKPEMGARITLREATYLESAGYCDAPAGAVAAGAAGTDSSVANSPP